MATYLTNDKAPEKFVLFKYGKNETANGLVIVNDRSLKSVIDYIKLNGNKKLRIDLEHLSHSKGPRTKDQMASYGWFTPEIDEDKNIIANVSWTPEGAELIELRKFCYTSPACNIDMKSRVLNFITDAALTNDPATTYILPLLTLNKESNMKKFLKTVNTINELLSKHSLNVQLNADVNEEDKELLADPAVLDEMAPESTEDEDVDQELIDFIMKTIEPALAEIKSQIDELTGEKEAAMSKAESAETELTKLNKEKEDNKIKDRINKDIPKAFGEMLLSLPVEERNKMLLNKNLMAEQSLLLKKMMTRSPNHDPLPLIEVEDDEATRISNLTLSARQIVQLNKAKAAKNKGL